MTQGRNELVDYIRESLAGPSGGSTERLRDRPDNFYTAAVLHPQDSDTTHLVEEQGGEATASTQERDLIDEAVRLTSERLPSSAALTFFVKGPDPKLVVRADAGRYSAIETYWQRTPLAETQVHLTPTETHRTIWDGSAEIVSRWRRSAAGHLVTVAIVNTARKTTQSNVTASCLFQVALSCEALRGEVGTYPHHTNLAVSNEEAELLLRYSHQKTYAIGHGCAVDWEESASGIKVALSFLPFVEVPPLVTAQGNEQYLRLTALSHAPRATLKASLNTFVDGYSTWLAELKLQEVSDNEILARARNRILERIEIAIDRMRDGIAALDDDLTHSAFQLAHKAMILQMKHSENSLGGQIRDMNSAPEMPTEETYQASEASWRPFQLGFILTSLRSVIDPADEHRDTVDLIWAATGSGKTEAYLALAAMTIIHRRLKNGPAGGGTAVITRYTLRLLTTQQFERTSRLVCALEILRRDRPELGTEPFTIGLWVGRDSTPNSFEDARETVQELLAGSESSGGIQLEKCPWCGVRIIPLTNGPQEGLGIEAAGMSFKIHCRSMQCDFDKLLPMQVVDAALYENPPTILIGTVDKFARLAWVEEPGIFFGQENKLPPSLIIQDELHLLSGPLGTTVGLYEAAIETLCELRGASPKVLAATATIREAPSQIQALYGRNSHLFPPAGLDERDSYFTKVDSERSGRGYLGVLSHNHTPSTSMVRTCAVLLQGAKDVPMEREERDAYWTLVAYHNSLRELGKTLTFARDDIPARIEVISQDGDARPLDQDDVLELTGSINSSQIPENLNRLAISIDDPGTVSFAVCTNMLSVGVDVPRLGLMVVNGQPKTTSEYIQASSRVGRGSLPGLVLTHYSSTKPRDRSHYEQFSSYHRALYRWVEPTSVTPFSLPARNRALAAALVILVRHGLRLSGNAQAHEFNRNDPNFHHCLDLFMKRVEAADPDEAGATRLHLQRLVDHWSEEIRQCSEERKILYFNVLAGSQMGQSLIGRFDSAQGVWPVPNSMRNVDSECPVNLIPEYDWLS